MLRCNLLRPTEADHRRIAEGDGGLDGLLARASGDEVLIEREGAVGDGRVGRPRIEAAQCGRHGSGLGGFRGLVADGSAPALEVQCAVGGGSEILAGVAGELDLAIAVQGSSSPAQAEQSADGRDIDLLKAALESVRGLVLVGGGLIE